MLVMACAGDYEEAGSLGVADNGRYFVDADGSPFFWLGDTGWLIFSKLTQEEAEMYLIDRKEKGFNVIQVMLLHTLTAANAYGDSALYNADVSMPNTGGLKDTAAPGYWELVDHVVDFARRQGLYMAMVPIWGTNVKEGKVTPRQAEAYARFLGNRYKDDKNVIWLNGGDIRGDDSIAVWQAIGRTLREVNPGKLTTFHPRGRTSSTDWFHEESWLDFNMFQSGHRRYDQDTSSNEKHHYGEDNWRYVAFDYSLQPAKPTLDGEPSYEGIPQGLHDPGEPVWTDADVRRYAYWSVFAGACGFTYGHNSVMQFHRLTDTVPAFGATMPWTAAIHAPGAQQMKHLKSLMLSRPFLERVPDQGLLVANGERYAYRAATRGSDYAFIYAYNGGEIHVNMGRISGKRVKAAWFDPRTGHTEAIGELDNSGTHVFRVPGPEQDGNDWVLILDSV
ncbi:Putative collagen-binding domain of a collagenase [Parapedobacter composti]|uniref:Putative collagen-binding domain of a collagenase n=1 Tax=Parapedobacter composti TaxID=623281 RepID=A0A1I1GTZ2_9SPHI|nr:Putative collagen-binding domain of a collagenase [Parapedobacter composti]